jgi:23S rRNA pseudouridine2605 synthase
MSDRLQKLIAHAGLASRREAETLITNGKVRVNGVIVRELGTQADPEVDVILVHNKPLPKPTTVVYLLHKQRGFVCSRKQQADEKLVTELVPPYPRVYPVGRLDKESEGLILLTNDGDLTQKLTHPKHEVPKNYTVTCTWQKNETVRTIAWIEQHLKTGVKLGDGKAKADSIRVKELPNGTLVLQLTIHEGRHHLVRRMCGSIGLEVERLQRTSIGPLTMNRLSPGDYRVLTNKELSQLTHG